MSGRRTSASWLIFAASSDLSSPALSFNEYSSVRVSTISLRNFAWSSLGTPWLYVFLSEGSEPTGSNGLFGMNTVAIAGRPMRSTWSAPMFVVAQTPILLDPDRVSSDDLRSRTMDETLLPANLSDRGDVHPRNDFPGALLRVFRKPSRSEKNGSSRMPANARTPLPLFTATLPNRLVFPLRMTFP